MEVEQAQRLQIREVGHEHGDAGREHVQKTSQGFDTKSQLKEQSFEGGDHVYFGGFRCLSEEQEAYEANNYPLPERFLPFGKFIGF